MRGTGIGTSVPMSTNFVPMAAAAEMPAAISSVSVAWVTAARTVRSAGTSGETTLNRSERLMHRARLMAFARAALGRQFGHWEETRSARY